MSKEGTALGPCTSGAPKNSLRGSSVVVSFEYLQCCVGVQEYASVERIIIRRA